jgi:hypothetical protein
VERVKTLYLLPVNLESAYFVRALERGKGEGGERGKGKGKGTHRNDPSKIAWIKKSKICHINSTRHRPGVSGRSTARERPYANKRSTRTAERERSVVVSRCCMILLLGSAMLASWWHSTARGSAML